MIFSLSVNKSALDGHGSRLGAILGMELGEDLLDVVLGCFFGDTQVPGDLFVGEAADDQAEHIHFAHAQFAFRAVCVQQGLNDVGREHRRFRRLGGKFRGAGNETLLRRGGDVLRRVGSFTIVGHVSAFFVDPKTPGFSISKPMRTMGFMTNGVYGLTFENCEIPAENLLGEENKGFYYAVAGLNEARVNVGCVALGGSQIAFEHALQYSKDRVTFGQPLASHQVLQHMLADMAMEQHAARTLLLDAAWSLENGVDVRLKCSYAKVFCSEVANRVADKALQIFGGAGYIKGMVVERVYRESRVTRIFEGANEIQRNMIAKQLLAM